MRQGLACTVLLLLLSGCTGLQPSPPDRHPILVRVDYNQERDEDVPGLGRVAVLHEMGHIQAVVRDADLVLARVFPAASEGPPLAVFFLRRWEDAWGFDWEDPPAAPVRLVLYAAAARGDAVPLTSALVRGDGLGGDGTGLLTRVPPNQAELRDVVTRFFMHLSGGEGEQAWALLHESARRPNPAISEEEARQKFLASATRSGPQVAAYLGAQMWASRKFPWCMCSLPVTEAFFRSQDGAVRSVFALPDQAGRWRLVWTEYLL